MSDNYLVIVEGEKTEKNIFEAVLERYGFNVIRMKEKLDVEGFGQFERNVYSDDKKNVVIIQGPRNRIHDFLKSYNKNTEDVERFFSDASIDFHGIFLIYDVDHNDEKDIKEMYDKFPDESSGILLLSSPCIEVLAEYNDGRTLKYNHLKEYKADLNVHYNEAGHKDAENYIINNFEKCALYFLNKNYHDFNEPNIMEHPSLVIDKINKENDRVNYSGEKKEESYVIYRYLTTVVYVFIAYINGLTREIDNYEAVKVFFQRHLK